LDELEAAKEQLEISILQEEMQKPLLTREQVVFWISRFKKGNIKDPAFRSKLIDAFVNSIYLHDDKMVLTYNYKDGTKTVSLSQVEDALGDRGSGSDLEALAPPSYPRPLMRTNKMRELQTTKSLAFFVKRREEIICLLGCYRLYWCRGQGKRY
jgi:hypothetical protein